MNTLKKALLLSAVSIANRDGFTVDSQTLTPITEGFAVAVTDTQDSFDELGLSQVLLYAENHPEINAFGGWYNYDNGLYYYDAVIVVDDLNKAIELGRANNQIAIYDLTNNKEIRL